MHLFEYIAHSSSLTLFHLHPGIPIGRLKPVTVSRLHFWYRLSEEQYLVSHQQVNRVIQPFLTAVVQAHTRAQTATLLNLKIKHNLNILKETSTFAV